MLVNNNRSDSIIGLFLSIVVLLSARQSVKNQFINELEMILKELEKRNQSTFDKMCRKYMIPKNICSLLRKIWKPTDILLEISLILRTFSKRGGIFMYPVGLEPTTGRLWAVCSDQLS